MHYLHWLGRKIDMNSFETSLQWIPKKGTGGRLMTAYVRTEYLLSSKCSMVLRVMFVQSETVL